MFLEESFYKKIILGLFASFKISHDQPLGLDPNSEEDNVVKRNTLRDFKVLVGKSHFPAIKQIL